MEKVSASETKRIITAIKRRDPLTDDPWSLFYRPHRRIQSGPDEAVVRQPLEELGLDSDEIKQINKMLRRKQMERLRARERRPVGNKQSVVEAKKLLRRWVEEQRRYAKRLRPLQLPWDLFVVLNRPFLIWANPTQGLLDSKIVASNSTAQFDADYNDQIPTADHSAFAWLAFFFLWQNDRTAKDLSAQTHLFVQGHGDCLAVTDWWKPLSTTDSEFSWDASFRIMFWERGSGTDVPFQASQRAHIKDLDSFAEDIPGYRRVDKTTNVSQQVPLSYTHLIVPPRQVIVFAVALHVTSTLYHSVAWASPSRPLVTLSSIEAISGAADSHCKSDFSADQGFLGCPFVNLEIRSI
jgi:hypothetical protein